MTDRTPESELMLPIPEPTIAAPPAPAKKTTKRADILEAALALFVDRGFHGTAVPALAQRANVGAGTIYRYFENKEALVNELYRQWKMAISEHVMSAIEPDLAPRELFGRFWNKTIEFAQIHPRAFAFLELHHHSSYLDDESREVEANVLNLASTIIVAMKSEDGVKDLPPSLLMAIVYGALVGFVRGAWEGMYPLDGEHCERAEACAWEAVRR